MKLLEKDRIKSLIAVFILITIIELIIIVIVTNVQYNYSNKMTNKKISQIVGKVEQEYPNVSETDIIKILNSDVNSNDQLSKYGLNIDNTIIVEENEKAKNQYIIYELLIITAFHILIFICFIIYLNYREKKIKKITQYVKEINNKKYSIKLNNMTEGELSKLESELYKITVMLKQDAESSKSEKKHLAESIADISHQIKTPLTSISIMLENLNSNEKMDPKVRKQFINEITKQVEWMKWLVISLLKFSKLDANAVEFKHQSININELVQQIIENMLIPLEIKNIDVVVAGDSKAKLIGDFNWENEALTNILKNCIEHTSENKKIYISFEENNIYSKIIIKDEGSGISKKDLPYIFERFYKGKDSSNESYGIGLALSKSIIEKDNGIISCTSELNKGTIFEIKYAK